MQDMHFLKTDIIQNDLVSRSRFLSLSEELLTGSSFQKAAEIAQARLASIPGDVDARMVLGRALLGLGDRNEAFEIFADIRRSLERWSSMLDLLEDPLRSDPPYSSSEIPASANSLQIETERISQPEGQPLHGDFYTMTMAELFIKQGHFEMARQVLEGILKINPHETGVLERLTELKSRLGKVPTVNSKTGAIDELERWLGKLRS